MKQPKQILFKSVLANQMQEFVQARQLSGTDYRSQAQLLKLFDQFLVQEQVQQTKLNATIYQHYLSQCSHLSERSLLNRISVIRQFYRFLAQTGQSSFSPEPIVNKKNYEVYVPTIFTLPELKCLFAQAKTLPPHNPSIRAKTFYTLLGLLYTTGIRIGEALALNLEDYSNQTQRIHIRQGKFRKARWLCLKASTCELLDNYLRERLQWASYTLQSPFFISLRKNRLSYSAASVTFRTVLKACHWGKQHSPHLHDLRHTFAVHRLTQWYQQGIDINACLPALATYLGHVDIAATQVYLHTTPQLLALVSDNFHQWFQERVINGEQK